MLLLLLLLLLHVRITVTDVSRIVGWIVDLISKTVLPVTIRIRKMRKLGLLIDRRTVRPVIATHVTVLFFVLGGHEVTGTLLISVRVGLRRLLVEGWTLGHKLDRGVGILGQEFDQARLLGSGTGLEILVVGGRVKPFQKIN